MHVCTAGVVKATTAMCLDGDANVKGIMMLSMSVLLHSIEKRKHMKRTGLLLMGGTGKVDEDQRKQ
jgi:hypothetical protein